MAYNRSNLNELVKDIVSITKTYYEPGRQDRNFTWIWRTQIRGKFHICYNTYMAYLRSDTEFMTYYHKLKADYKTDLEMQKAERMRNPRRRHKTQTATVNITQ